MTSTTNLVNRADEATDDPFSTVEDFELDPAQVPSRTVETSAHRRRARRRRKLFVPAVPWLEMSAALSRLSTSRAVLLWHLLRMQAKMEAQEWLSPRLSFLAEAGLGDRKARSRAVAELEQAGLVEVRRRPGKLPLLRLIEPSKPGGDDHG